MTNYFTLENGAIKMGSGTDFHQQRSIFWIDLIDPTFQEKQEVEKFFNVELFTEQESEEIESSSKYIETGEEIGINLNFLKREEGNYINEPVSFIIRNKLLITQRTEEFRTFKDIYRKIRLSKPEDGEDVFLSILETRIDFDADLIENITERINNISREMVTGTSLEREILLQIASLQESTIAIRENIVEKQRILSSVIKSRIFPREHLEKMRVMLQDVSSLLDHTAFNFERLEFLQNTFLGLVNMEQNRVIKIFTVMTVVFMPPTLIASMYGMNFHFMPELDERWGYPFAILLMVTSSALTLLFFRRKKWL